MIDKPDVTAALPNSFSFLLQYLELAGVCTTMFMSLSTDTRDSLYKRVLTLSQRSFPCFVRGWACASPSSASRNIDMLVKYDLFTSRLKKYGFVSNIFCCFCFEMWLDKFGIFLDLLFSIEVFKLRLVKDFHPARDSFEKEKNTH